MVTFHYRLVNFGTRGIFHFKREFFNFSFLKLKNKIFPWLRRFFLLSLLIFSPLSDNFDAADKEGERGGEN